MAIIHQCSEQDCRVLTMGEYCLQHELERQAPQDLTRKAPHEVRSQAVLARQHP